MTKLKIADGLELPIDAGTQTFAILGIRGSGKTNTAVSVAEEMLKLGQQISVLDPTDGWWGLRSSKDGRSEGFKVIVVGGEHGDIPLEGTGGKLLAEFVVETGASVVFSLRHLSINDQRRFAADFAERLYELKGKPENRTALHIFVDEADEFIPQRIPPGHERMFGAFDRLVRRGRNSGIGLTMISQRPQVLNKDTLSQCETLICHRLLHKLDRKAVKEGWVEGHDTGGKATELMDSLASLGRGDAWVWSPYWLDLFKRVHIRERETFDSSFTPKAGERPKKASKLADVDLDALKQKLSATIEKAKADDPKELRKKIAELERELAKKPATVAAPAVEPIVQEKLVEVPFVRDSELDLLNELVGRIEAVRSGLGEELRIMGGHLEGAVHSQEKIRAQFADKAVNKFTSRQNLYTPSKNFQAVKKAAPVSAPRAKSNGDGSGLSGPQVEMLGRMSEFRSAQIVDVRLSWLAGSMGTTVRARGFVENMRILRKGGYLESSGAEKVRLTGEGFAMVGEREALYGAQLHAKLRELLSGPQWQYLEELMRHSNGVTAEDLATRFETTVRARGFEENVRTLRAYELAEKNGDRIKVAEWVMA